MALHAPGTQAALERLHRLVGTRHDALPRTIRGRQPEGAVEERPDVLIRQGHRQHRSLRHLLHQAPARRHQAQGILWSEDPREARGHVFPHAVAEHGFRSHAPGRPETGQGVLHHEQRGLRHCRLVQTTCRFGLTARGREEDLPQVEVQLRAEALRAAVDLHPERLFRPIQVPGHVRVLRALARKEDRHAAPRLVGRGLQPTRGRSPLERLPRARHVPTDHDAAMAEGAPAGLERVGDVGEVPLRVRLQVGGQVA